MEHQHSTRIDDKFLPVLESLRATCPLLATTTYLANCSQGPLTQPVRVALDTFLQDWATCGMHWDAWIAEVEQARGAFAALIGARPEEIAVGSSVSQLVSSLASALVSTPALTRRRIVTSEAEFPGVVHAWLATSTTGYHVYVQQGEQGMVTDEHLLTALDTDTVLLSAPHVCYANGTLLDLPRLAEAAHAQGSFIFVDAYQSIGTTPIDVKADGIDFLAAGTLKYLLGTAGIAFLYINPALLPLLTPTVTGWFGRVDPFAFALQLDYADRAARFDLGTPPLFAAYAAHAGIQLILATGVATIRQQIERLSRLAVQLAPQKGLHLLGPLEAERRGATIALDTGSPACAHALEEQLRQQNIVVSARNRALRLAPHGFTHLDEIEKAIDVIAHLMQD